MHIELQSVKSKRIHFNSKICRACNSERTQPADRAFDMLHKAMLRRYAAGLDLTDTQNRPIYDESGTSTIDVFRYFAKVICCFLAEVGGPRPKIIANFAIGRSGFNPIKLRISRDSNYELLRNTIGTKGYASHGGLAFGFSNQKMLVRTVKSSISSGGIQYEFCFQLKPIASIELMMNYPELIRKARLSSNP